MIDILKLNLSNLKLKTINPRQKGQALFEFLIATALGLILSSGVLFLFLSIWIKIWVSHWAYEANLCLAASQTKVHCKKMVFRSLSRGLPSDWIHKIYLRKNLFYNKTQIKLQWESWSWTHTKKTYNKVRL